MPQVSIIMPAHNAANTIRESIDSVLSQTFTDWELLTINDSSTDETEQIVSEYIKKDNRIKLLHTDKSVGKPKTICLHDFWLGLVATKIGKMYWHDAPLVLHRVGKQNTSTGGKKSNNSLWIKFLYRYFAFIEYLKLDNK